MRVVRYVVLGALLAPMGACTSDSSSGTRGGQLTDVAASDASAGTDTTPGASGEIDEPLDARGSSGDVDIPGSGPEGLKGGTRLRALGLGPLSSEAFDPKTDLPWGWYDTALDTECRFVETTPRQFHCVPTGEGGLRVYSSAACEPADQLMALLVSGSPTPDCTPRYLWQGFEDASCPANSRGVALKITGPATASLETHGYVQTYFGDCNKRPAPPPPPDPGPQWVYCKVEEVPLEELVSAAPELRDVADVRLQTLRASDGTVVPQRLWSAAVDAPLNRDYWTGEQLVPATANFGLGVYADPARTVSAICVDTEAALCANVVVMQTSECAAAAQTLGEPLDKVYGAEGAGELPRGICYGLGAPLAEVPYSEVAVGDGRLRPLWIDRDGEALVPTDSFRDEELGVVCRPEVVEGVHRCMSTEFLSSNPPYGWRHVYASVNGKSQCETSLGYVYYPRCGEAPGRFLRQQNDVVEVEALPEAPPAQVFAGVGPPGEEIYACQPLADPPSVLYKATPVPLDRFVELHQTRAQ